MIMASISFKNVTKTYDGATSPVVPNLNLEITEDDLKSAEKDIQDGTDQYVKEIDALVSEKEKEILSV